MPNPASKGKLGRRMILVLMIIIMGVTSAMSTKQTGQSLATILVQSWRGVGNSLLELNINSAKWVSVDFSQEPYPMPANDKAFYTRAQIDQKIGSTTNLQSFKLLCGVAQGEQQRTTDVVFWTGDNWEGTSQRFTCGGSSNDPNAYEISGNITTARSFCLVTDRTAPNRRARCLNGPRCDDGRMNGGETGIDCGGSCSPCPLACVTSGTATISLGLLQPGGIPQVWKGSIPSSTLGQYCTNRSITKITLPYRVHCSLITEVCMSDWHVTINGQTYTGLVCNAGSNRCELSLPSPIPFNNTYEITATSPTHFPCAGSSGPCDGNEWDSYIFANLTIE